MGQIAHGLIRTNVYEADYVEGKIMFHAVVLSWLAVEHNTKSKLIRAKGG